MSGEVSKARAVLRPSPHSPHPQRPAIAAVNQQRKGARSGVGGVSNVLFVSFLLNCLPPPANPGTPGSRIFCKMMSLLTEPTVSYQLRCVSCSVSIQGGDDGRWLLSESHSLQRCRAGTTRSEPEESRQHTDAPEGTRRHSAPASGLHCSVPATAFSFLIAPTESRDARCRGLEALAFSADSHPFPAT